MCVVGYRAEVARSVRVHQAHISVMSYSSLEMGSFKECIIIALLFVIKFYGKYLLGKLFCAA